jgi:hypothetical protein
MGEGRIATFNLEILLRPLRMNGRRRPSESSSCGRKSYGCGQTSPAFRRSTARNGPINQDLNWPWPTC